jgi:hypothetical protein
MGYAQRGTIRQVSLLIVHWQKFGSLGVIKGHVSHHLVMFCSFVHVFLCQKSLLDNHSTSVILSSKVWIRTPLEAFFSLSLSLFLFLFLPFFFSPFEFEFFFLF